MTYKRTKTEDGKNFDKAIKELKDNRDVAKIGWMGNQIHPNSNTTVATIAAIHELGAPSKGIPPRPFFKPTIIAKKKEWKKISLNEIRKILNGETTVYNFLETIGLIIAADVRETITQIRKPKLNKNTIKNRLRKRGIEPTEDNLKKARKLAKLSNTPGNATYALGIDKPLVETGILLDTLTSKVEKK